ncbi:MFS transporter [Rhodopila sp.]|uniref:MFS transporter n=1 Tax=Rhodopila sp. TaxID=2480087 RepID=UPI003D0D381E
MFEVLDQRLSLTGNQKRIVAAAVLGDMLEFFDYFLIGFVLAFVVGPWKLTFLQSAMILLSSGIGAILGAAFWGWMADKIGRRPVFNLTILNFSLATGALYFTPDHGWIFLMLFRTLVGFGVGGLYCVDLPLVQEFMPASKRGFIGGLVTSFIPIGVMIGSLFAGYLTPEIGWRGLFAIGVLPGLAVLLIRVWVPESPRWLLRQGRVAEAKKSLAWALEVEPDTLPDPTPLECSSTPTRFLDLFSYPRSLMVSWLGNLGAQTGVYGVILWAPTLFVLVLHVSAAEASKAMIALTIGGIVGRVAFSWLSEQIGRRLSGGILGFGAALFIALAGIYHSDMMFGVSAFWLLLIVAFFFADGGFAVVGPYAAEVWPSHLRTSGMGSAYGFGGIGKIIGPLGLALVVGSSNVVKPEATIGAIQPAFLYLASWFVLSGAVYLFLGIETKGRSIEEIDRTLKAAPAVAE